MYVDHHPRWTLSHLTSTSQNQRLSQNMASSFHSGNTIPATRYSLSSSGYDSLSEGVPPLSDDDTASESEALETLDDSTGDATELEEGTTVATTLRVQTEVAPTAQIKAEHFAHEAYIVAFSGAWTETTDHGVLHNEHAERVSEISGSDIDNIDADTPLDDDEASVPVQPTTFKGTDAAQSVAMQIWLSDHSDYLGYRLSHGNSQ